MSSAGGARAPFGWEEPMFDKVYDVPAEWAKRAWVNAAKYKEMYELSLIHI